MNTGDLVRLKDNEGPRFKREIGTILRFDEYCGSLGTEYLVEVLWNTGKPGWVLASRVEIVNESR